ncbi:Rh-like protein/ammonium transporter [Tieghemostelium lacteum]|uniref:Rh-like protein/ammonium transporter n=1 Tax=Tieghemostelium lacteum TaxID=361077 RepID=A0A151ZFU9_TIELA|nr:Rh-like protein/ammonium transporter [Tieghemostelium lacteum]|eukprot:KYQ92843.1 Rh-like protein/ammonium transporter [Tieghemostelium lacteum]
MIILYAIWVRYDSNEQHQEELIPAVDANGTVILVPNPVQDDVTATYGYFRDVNIMIFFGFGFLMTFLRRYGYSALGYTFIISAMVAQWSVLVFGFFETVYDSPSVFHDTFYFDITTLLNGLFCAGAVMISYGAILGKITPLQLLIMGIVEPMFYFLNMFIGEMHLKAIDVGGGMYIHLFGCYFGLTVSWFLTNKKGKESPNNAPSYNGDLFAMAGTLFLWMMWPSFNAAIAPAGDAQFRAIANTFISLTGSTIATFIVSRLLGYMGHKLDMVHVQNSTLAGGVVQGCVAHLNINPGAAIAMGFIAGTVSVLGYVKLTPFISNKLNIHDTCGINNLHGMPGFIGSVAAIIAAAHGINNKDLYFGDDYDNIFRVGDSQAKHNAAATFITIGIAIVGGIITGIFMKLVSNIGKLATDEYYSDHAFWHVASDYPKSLADDPEAGGNQNVEMESHSGADIISTSSSKKSKKSQRSPSYKRDLIRILETLVREESRNNYSDSDSDSESDNQNEEEPRRHRNRKNRQPQQQQQPNNNTPNTTTTPNQSNDTITNIQ